MAALAVLVRFDGGGFGSTKPWSVRESDPRRNFLTATDAMKRHAPTIPPSPRGEAAALLPARRQPAAAIPWAERIALRRKSALDVFDRCRAQGHTYASAASEAGVAISSISRWSARLAAEGLPGLMPRAPKGRPPLVPVACYSRNVVREMQRLSVIYGGANAAGRVFARFKTCPAPLASFISARGVIPPQLRDRIGYRRRPLNVRQAGRFVHCEGIPNPIAA